MTLKIKRIIYLRISQKKHTKKCTYLNFGSYVHKCIRPLLFYVIIFNFYQLYYFLYTLNDFQK